MGELPLEAPVMSMARFFVSGAVEKEFESVCDAQLQKVVDGSKPFKVAAGWRYDEGLGKREMLVFSGWGSKEAHMAFGAEAKKDPEYARIGELPDAIEIKHMTNLEA